MPLSSVKISIKPRHPQALELHDNRLTQQVFHGSVYHIFYMKRTNFLMKSLMVILIGAALLVSCATPGKHASFSSAEQLSVHKGHARALYLYSRARLASIEGDYPAALNLLRLAIEEEPDSAFLHAAIAENKLKIGQVQEALEYIFKAIKLDPAFREPYVMAGVLMASAGKDVEAAGYLRTAVKLDPAKEDAYLHLAVSLTRLFEYEEAVNTLKSLVKLNSESVLGYYYLGRTYSQMKLYRDAIGYFEKTLELRPEFYQAAIDMAASYEALEDFTKAIEVYRTLLDEDESRAAVLQRLIQLLIQQRRFEEALEHLKLAVESGLGGAETMRKIGLIHLELEQYDQAIAVFNELLAKNPDAEPIRLYLGVAYEEKGDLDHAYAEFMKIPHGSPVYIDAVGHIALILKEKGQTAAAVDILKNAIDVNPGQIELYLNLSSIYEADEKTESALKLLLDTEKRFEDDPRLQFRIGVLYDKLGKKQESIVRMKKVLGLTPRDAQALNFLGYTYAEMGENLEEALGYLKQAVELRPNDGFILDSLGWVYFRMKKYDQAVSILEEASRLVDDDSTIAEHLGDAYQARHDHKKALKAYKKALELDPSRKELSEKIRRLKGELGER
jgi:tetratricopeptide (TPR) repeat protein